MKMDPFPQLGVMEYDRACQTDMMRKQSNDRR
jgi:hypothetical protein